MVEPSRDLLTAADSARKTLLNRRKSRRNLGIVYLILGPVLAAGGIWSWRQSVATILEVVESFADTPGIALPLVSMATSQQTTAHLAVIAGMILAAHGLVLLLVREPLTEMLSGLVEQVYGSEGER
jgi:hypothetical protein